MQRKNKTISLRISEILYDRLQTVAKAQDMTVSETVTLALEVFCEPGCVQPGLVVPIIGTISGQGIEITQEVTA